MVKDPKRAKTESLSLRLDPKTKFILEFIARLSGQSITTVVERAIKSAAERISVGTSESWDGTKTWMAYWDASEGVRTLQLISDPEYPTTFEEDEFRAFTKAHWQFFYTSAEAKIPRRGYLDILWPHVSEYLTIWQEKREENYWAAGDAMKRALSAARIEAPSWPPETKKLVFGKPPTAPASTKSDTDDDIPF